jgi:hypothetical protein
VQVLSENLLNFAENLLYDGIDINLILICYKEAFKRMYGAMGLTAGPGFGHCTLDEMLQCSM